MSNTPFDQDCKIDGCSGPAHYTIGTSPEYGPDAAFSIKIGAGKYCLTHAKERANELRPAWQARRQAKLDASHKAHAAWKAQYDATTRSN